MLIYGVTYLHGYLFHRTGSILIAMGVFPYEVQRGKYRNKFDHFRSLPTLLCLFAAIDHHWSIKSTSIKP
jgi:hypothetical protein